MKSFTTFLAALFLSWVVTTFAHAGIAVEQPEGSELTSGRSKSDFGTAIIGASGGMQRFTVRNTGPDALSGLAVTVSGGARQDYTIHSSDLPATLAEGASGSFTVAFHPWQSGKRQATLQIASDDPVLNPFEIKLIGKGLTQPGPFQSIATAPMPALVSTASPPFPVIAGATSGLPLTYSVLAGPATISNGGTITISGVPGTVTIRIGQAGGSVYDAAEAYVSFPVVAAGQEFVTLAKGPTANHFAGIRANGTLWTWGGNESGQLGNGSSGGWGTGPEQVGTATWSAAACGFSHTVAVKDNGTLWAWGNNDDGRLGDGTSTQRSIPVQIGSENTWTAVASGDGHSIGLRDDGTLWAWGRNNRGQLGDGTKTNRQTPVQIGTGNTWTVVACGHSHSVAVKSDGTLWAWGDNGSGQLANKSKSRSSPVQVGTSANWATASCGAYHTVALQTDHTLWAWGDNRYGQLGNGGTSSSQKTPLRIGSSSDWATIACGFYHTMAVKNDHTLWAFGIDSSAQLGDAAASAYVSSPVRIGTAANWAAIACAHRSVAIQDDGSLWSWGYSAFDNPVLEPLENGAGNSWSVVSSGVSHTAAVKSDGTLWSWGLNDSGQLGQGTTENGTHPNQIGSVSKWAEVGCGERHTLAIQKNGSLWSWGDNLDGQLGIGSQAASGSPVRVGSNKNWSKAAGGYRHSVAIRKDGTLWAWGGNFWGQLGDGTTTSRPSPVRIGTASDWAEVACGFGNTLAIKTDGSQWEWGLNSSLVPTQSGSDRDWAEIACGNGGSFNAAVKADGSLWTWGDNGNGRLGDGTTINRLAPVRIGTDFDWVRAACGLDHGMAVKRDGTLWAWGVNTYGQLGDGTTTTSYSPVRIGTSAAWNKLPTKLGNQFSMVLTRDGKLWSSGQNMYGQLGTIDPGLPNRTWPARSKQTIGLPALPPLIAGQPVVLAATSTSRLPVIYTVSGPATFVGNTLTRTAEGAIRVIAWQAGDATWASAAPQAMAPPTVSIATVSEVTSTTATLSASVNPGGLATSARFEYGPTTAYGSTADATLSPNNGSGAKVVTAMLTGLETGGTYHYRLTATNNLGTASGDDRVLITAPVIVVEQPAGTPLADGSASSDFGGSPIEEAGAVLTFTMRNAGSMTLTDLAVSVDGAAQSDYTVNAASLPATVAPGASATFTVAFLPSQIGARAAALQIASNDPANHSFDIGLTGTGLYATGPTQKIVIPATPSVVKAGSPPLALNATATSGLPLSYAVLTGPATVSTGGLVTLTGAAGPVTVKISQPGNGTFDPAEGYATFHVTATGQEFVKLARGTSATFSAGLRANGTIWTWGRNTQGQLGDGTTTTRHSPVQVGSDSNWTTLACGSNHTMAIKTDGTLWAWGYNFSNQLGDGTGTTRTSPVQIGTGSVWTSVSCGLYHTAAVKSDGTLWTWGWNGYGQLGDGSNTQRNSPVQVGTDTNWSKVSCGGNHTLAIKSTGALWSWGYNTYGQLGTGYSSSRNTPLQVGTGSDWAAVAGGQVHTLAVKTNGTLWSWGTNDNGQLGNGSFSSNPIPAQVGSATHWSEMVSAYGQSMAMTSDGTLWAWGRNDYGQVGDGTMTRRSIPIQIGPAGNWSAVACGNTHTVAVQTDGTLWTWGDNEDDQLGKTPETKLPGPVPAGPAGNGYWISVANGSSHTAAVRNDGTLWAWGVNTYGQLGDGTVQYRGSPVRIGLETDWVAVAAGDQHTVAIKNNGTLWAWGYNTNGNLGDGTTIQRLSPVRIGTGTTWAAVACGSNHTLSLKNDGTLWAWGRNSSGQLGDGSTYSSRTSPLQIGSASNWTSVSGGSTHSVARKSDGTLWTWGTNGNGQLGNGTTTTSTLPIKIGTAGDWATAVAGLVHTMAIKNDGTLWTWGRNDTNQLGDGTTEDSLSPMQIGSADNWLAAAGGLNHTMAIQNDGTLWGWGLNDFGQLGDGTTIQRSIPSRIGTSAAWGNLPARLGDRFSAVMTLGGSLWTFGDPVNGKLGYMDPSVPGRIIPARSPQTLVFSDFQPGNIGQPVTLPVICESRLPVSYRVIGPAMLSGNTLTRTADGTIQVIAWQPGDATWASTQPYAFSSPADVMTTAPTGVSPTGATLHGTVNPGGLITTARFEYGTTTAYGSVKDLTLSPADGTSTQAVNAALTSLTPGTTYHFRIKATNGLGITYSADQTFTAGDPVIAVEQPSGTGLTSGFSTVDFGNVTPGAAAGTLTFTVRNMGPGTLNGLAVSLDGAAQADYTLDAANLPGTLEPGDSSTFTVAFRTLQLGARAAALHIASNDPLRNPFNLALSGTGVALPGPGQSIVTAAVPVAVKTSSPPFFLQAAATSGLPVTYAVLTGPATISGTGTVTLTGGIGAVTVKISQAGGDGYDPVERYLTFQVTPSGQEFAKLARSPFASYSAGIRTDGTLWTWGDNSKGQLGDGTTTQRSAPVQVGVAVDWKAVACGFAHTIALKNNGTLWAWGTNGAGSLGDGTTTQRNSPVQIGTDNHWAKVACGYSHTLAIKTDGTLWVWGWNGFGSLGDGTTTNRTTPVQIGAATHWADVAGGDDHSMAVASNGTMWAWGENTSGQLGDGTLTQQNSPVKVGTATNWTAVTCGYAHSAGIRSDGSLWAWGSNSNGQLGDGTSLTRLLPRQIGAGKIWRAVAAGQNHTIALQNGGTLWTCGDNTVGQLGDGTTTQRNTLVPIGTTANWAMVTAGYDHMLALGADGTLSAWGSNASGQLGDGGNTRRPSPIPTGNPTGKWLALAEGDTHTVAVGNDGTLWAWGSNSNGQLGNGTTTDLTIPTQIDSATNWAKVAAGRNYTAAIKSDGTLWAWGLNDTGQLGDGTSTQRTVPVRITTATDWTSVSCGAEHTAAIKGGTLFTWGYNDNGQLGSGSKVTDYSPHNLIVDGYWIAAACGEKHTVGLKADGTLWTCGQNFYGQIGDGTSEQRTSMVQVGSATNWRAVTAGFNHNLAIKTDGTLWAWGRNSSGQLGDGAAATRRSPAQIGAGSNWGAVAGGESHSAALQTDNTLWTWGGNISGQLGDGTTTDQNTPQRIGAGNAWGGLPARLNSNFTVLQSLDGTLWTCGSGALGTDTRVPVFVWPLRSPQTLGFPTPAALGIGQPVTLTGTAGSQLPVVYHLTGPAALNGNVLTRMAAGFLQVVAWQPGDVSWASTEPIAFSSPSVTTQPATGVDANVATLNGTVNPHGLATTAQFEYGLTNAYGSTAVVTLSPNNGTSTQSLSVSLAGLQSGVTYHYRLSATSNLGTSFGVNTTFATPGPIIAVEQPAGTPLTSAIGSRDFGSAVIGEAGATLEFTVRNLGAGMLSGLALSLEGPGQADFTLHQVGFPTTLSPSAGATFSVNFRPWQSDLRMAVLRVASNDPATNPFEINLTGTGLVEPGSGPGQTIVAAPLTLVRADSAPFFLGAGATSGLPLTYELLAGPATINTDGRVTLTGAPGVITVHLTQPGGGGFDPAESDLTFHVTPPGREFVTISRGPNANHALGIRADGTLWAWGANGSGQLGDGGTVNRAEPGQVGLESTWVTAACGINHSVAIKSDGTLWAWGANGNGQLGDGSAVTRNLPVRTGTASNWAAVACGSNSTLAIKTDGTLWAWGQNNTSQLGDGSTTDRNTPVQIGTASNWRSVACGSQHGSAIKTDGTLWTWGGNASGQLGSGSNTSRNTPGQVGTDIDWKAIACGASHTAALKYDGTLWSWGLNASGQLGDGTFTANNTPAQIGTANSWDDLSAGANHTLAMQNDGTLWAWGNNTSGQVGDGSIALRNEPAPIGSARNWALIAGGASHTAALQSDGTLWSWGLNSSGQSGDGLTTQRLRPVSASGSWTAVANGSGFSLAVKSDGSLWAWGANGSGQLGDGTVTNSTSPIRIGLANDWAYVAAGVNHSLAIKSNGTLWTWGNNSSGQLGDPAIPTSGRSSPEQVGTETDWLTAACGTSFTLALKTTGTLWSWGANGFGQLGDSTVVAKTSPVQVGSATTWTAVACGGSHSFGLQNDGTLWAWGANGSGRLGDGTTTFRSSPVSIASATPWQAVTCGASHTLGLKTDGTLWAWGLNTSGQLGNGTTTLSTSPLQIGSGTGWAALAAGSAHSVALQIDGTLWAWGLNTHGQLADGTATLRTSPVSIGIGTAWGKLPVRLGDQFTSVLTRDGTLWTSGDRNSSALVHLDPTVPNRAWPSRASQTLGLPVLPALAVGQPVALAAVADSQLPVIYRVTGPATLSGNMLTPTAAGLIQLIAWQPGDANWATTEPLRQSQTATASSIATPVSPLENWRQTHFGNTTADTGHDEDFNHNGIDNLLEFAFGTHPVTSNPSALRFIGTFTGGGIIGATGQPIRAVENPGPANDTRVLFVRRSDFAAAGLTYVVQFSAALEPGNWMPGTAEPTVLADDGMHQIVSVPFPPLAGGRQTRFFRVQVTIPDAASSHP